MDTPIRTATIAELADIAARKAVETHEQQQCPFDAGSVEAIEWNRRFHIALVRHSAPADCEASA